MADKVFGLAPTALAPRLNNRFVDTANAVEQMRLGNGKKAERARVSQTSIQVKNLTGDDIDRGSVVELGTYLPTADTDTIINAANIWLQGNLYAAGGKIGIVRRAVLEDKQVECQLTGICIARVNFSDAAHRFARPKVGETYLESSGNAGPIVVLAKPHTGTGTQEAIVDLTPGRGMYIAKNGGSPIAARSGTTVSSGSVTLYYISGTTLTTLGVTVTAFNLSASAVAADAYLNVAIEAGSGKWLVTWEDCP